MTGSHEVRGSIPLGSTNSFNNLGHPFRMPFVVLCAYSVPTLDKPLHEIYAFVFDFGRNQQEGHLWLAPTALRHRGACQKLTSL